MTRVNLVPPVTLTDQHLFAEFRELKMIPNALAHSVLAFSKRGFPPSKVLSTIPKAFTLNTGHVEFFYNKGEYLHKRYDALREELDKRGINYNRGSQFDPDGVYLSLDESFNEDYTPTQDALEIIKERINEEIQMKPKWYRYYGDRLPTW